ncbi:GNAT family N-acetyltransferase [Candidatus Gracilibacteria bacterium]|nr:GNAT family N-acetyltransferase [Candidatus Gracilibacteria bacterium]
MKIFPRSLIPDDFTYYRTGSGFFFDYYRKYTNNIVERIGKGYEFFSAFRIFPGFWSVTLEKNDTELTRTELQKSGVSHGIIWWTPMRRIEKPVGWWRVPTWYTKRDIHSSRSAFSVLDQADYWNKWTPPARAHRRKVLENIGSGQIVIDSDCSLDDFLSLYRATPVSDKEKGSRIRMTRKLLENRESGYRIYTASVDKRVLAGAIFIDERVSSEYWVSFYHKDSHPYHLGIALIDRWFLDSYSKGIKYCDLDHMRDIGQSTSYSGYTQFKSSIADHDVYFHDMWIRIF